MKIAFAVAVLVTALAAQARAEAQAQTGPEPIPGIPGYDQPALGAEACHVANPGAALCTIPAKTSGRYLVVAAGTSTANGAKPAQAIAIGGDGFVCARATDTNAWTSGPRTLRVECTITVLTDRPLEVRVNYQDKDATKDPKGPKIGIQRLPWAGVVETVGIGAQAGTPQAAPAGETRSRQK